MFRLLVTLAAVVVFALSLLPACAQPGPYGSWETPGPATEPTPSYLGSTGLIFVPTAELLPPLQAAGFYHAISTEPRQQVLWGASLGLPGDLEVSGVRVQNAPPLPAAPDEYRSDNIFNLKYLLPLGQLVRVPQGPDVAVGIIDVENSINRVWYLSVMHPVEVEEIPGGSLTLHLGVGNADRGRHLDGLFGGVAFSPMRDAVVQVEADGKDLNAAFRYFPAPWLSLDAGIVSNEFAWGVAASSAF